MPGLEMVVAQGRKTAALKHPWSTMVKIALNPHLVGSPMIRSMVMVLNGSMSRVVGMQYIGVCHLWV